MQNAFFPSGIPIILLYFKDIGDFNAARIAIYHHVDIQDGQSILIVNPTSLTDIIIFAYKLKNVKYYIYNTDCQSVYFLEEKLKKKLHHLMEVFPSMKFIFETDFASLQGEYDRIIIYQAEINDRKALANKKYANKMNQKSIEESFSYNQIYLKYFEYQ